MVYNAVFWLNTFPHKDGVHATISPRTLVTGLGIDYNKHCKWPFGAYVQVHEEGDSLLRPRTSGAIALRPTGNEQGGHYFLSLHSGKRLNRYAWTEMPMPNEVIAQIHRLAVAAKKYDGIVFTDMQGNVLPEQMDEDEHNNDAYTTASEDTYNDQDHTGEAQGNDNNNNNDNDDDESTENQDTSNDVDNTSDAIVEAVEDITNETTDDPYEQNITIEDINIVTEMNTSQMATQQLEEEEDTEQPVQTHTYNLRT